MESDAVCISELRMDRATFRILCQMVSDTGGLQPTKNTSIEEVVAMFLYTLAHHKKSRTIGHLFFRSRETVSRKFHQVLNAILKLHHVLLKKPEPISQDCQDERWKCFQGCLGALDGTLIKVTPPSDDKSRYHTRKGCISAVPSSQTKKHKKLSSPTESSHKKKKSLTLEQTIDAKLESFSSDFKLVCGEMASKIGVAADALIVDANKSESVPEDKMQEVMNILINIGISHFDVGKVVEFCYNDPTKVKTLFLLPSYMRKSYVLGLLHPEN